jgi:hypothetical protein
MAARNITGSARIRAAQENLTAQNSSVIIAEISARMEDIRAVVLSSIDSLRCQNVRADADIAAALQRRALKPLDEVAQQLGTLKKTSR